MSIQNFNTFQNKNDISLAKTTEKYVIEALANLGQRYSIQGDGFSTRTSTIYDLIENFAPYDSASYICKVDYDEDHQYVEFCLVDKDLKPIQNIDVKKIQVSDIISKIKTKTSYQPLEIGVDESIIDYDSEDYSDGSSSYDDEAPIMLKFGIDEIDLANAKNVFMYANTNSFVFSLEENVEGLENRFVCEKYNKYSNKLDSAIRIFGNDVKIDNNTYDHTLLYMVSNGDNTYKLFVYHMNFANIDELKTNGIQTIARHAQKKYNGQGAELTETPNEDISFSPESFVTDLYTRCTKVGELKTVFAKESKSYNVEYDSNGNSYVLHLNEEETNTEVAKNFEKYKKLVQYFAYDQTYMYRQLKSSYSSIKFKDEPTNSSYKELILVAIKDLFVHTYYDNKPFYIPLDYAFEYCYNTNNPWQVYFSTTDIALRDVLEMKPGLAYTVFAYQDTSGIVRVLDKSSDVEKTTFYKFNVEYDPEDKSTIYGITISKHFTMPYINQFGYWVIDDIETEVYARGRDAGNPNIIIVETVKGKDTPTILTMSNKDYFESLNWVTKKAKIDLPKRIIRDAATMSTALAIPESDVVNINPEYIINNETGTSQTIYCDYLVPTLNNTSKKRLEENIDKLQYSIILDIAHVESVFGYDDDQTLKESINKIYGEDGRIMTFWVLDEIPEESCGYGFKFIETVDDTAVDINYMSNFVNTISWVLENYAPTDPDNFTFTQLVFDRADAQLMNNANDLTRVWPVIRNESLRTASQSNEDTGFNNFNLKIQYNDTIDASYYTAADEAYYLSHGKSYVNGINNISQSERRYFDAWNDLDSNEKVSNAIYETRTGNVSDNFTEYVPGTLDESVPTLDLSEMLVKDLNAINKANIVSFDGNSTTYYSYIGTDFTSEDKSILKIGTSTRNINLGTTTLVSERGQEIFTKQREIDIEFDNTRISSYAYVGNDLITERDTITYGTTWRRYDLNGTTYWTTSFRQAGRFFKDYLKACTLNDTISETNIETFDPMSNSDMNSKMETAYYSQNYAFVALTVPEQYKTSILNSSMSTSQESFDMYIADMVWVPGLMHTICPQLDGNMYSIYVSSSNDVIYSSHGGVLSYIGVRINSTMVEDLYEYEHNDTATIVSTSLSDAVDNMEFVSSPLDITYYVKDNKYYFNIEDSNNSSFMTYLHKLRQQY